MYLTRRFYIAFVLIILAIASGYWYAPLFGIGKVVLWLFLVLVAADYALLYHRRGIKTMRFVPERFSNGDENEVRLRVESTYPFPVWIDIIDEIPFIFQRRDISFKTVLRARRERQVRYRLRPTHRGVYGFGRIRTFVSTPLGLLARRFTTGEPQDVKVYPSFLMLQRYELLAISNRLTDMGIKKIRRIGHNTEFEQIKDYVQGDDFRTINWKATARRHQLMTNVYQDERSQQLFCVIDKGRVMQQAFRGMTLLDYAINASLVLSYVAIRREDKAGLLTFDDHFDSYLPAEKQPGHLQAMLETLYAQQSTFGESDFSALADSVNQHISKRSLLVLFTNFSGKIAMERQLPYLRQLSRHHRLLVVFFEDMDLKAYNATTAHTTEEYYQHVIGEKFAYEQRLVASLLRQQGILSLYTTPENLSVDVINKYLEMKTRGLVG